VAVEVAVLGVQPVPQAAQELLLLATQAPHKKHTVELIQLLAAIQSTHLLLQVVSTLVLLKQLAELLLLMVQTGFIHLHHQERLHLLRHYLVTTL
jgi:hypothetical protein